MDPSKLQPPGLFRFGNDIRVSVYGVASPDLSARRRVHRQPVLGSRGTPMPQTVGSGRASGVAANERQPRSGDPVGAGLHSHRRGLHDIGCRLRRWSNDRSAGITHPRQGIRRRPLRDQRRCGAPDERAGDHGRTRRHSACLGLTASLTRHDVRHSGRRGNALLLARSAAGRTRSNARRT
jgi:hypothetical protein